MPRFIVKLAEDEYIEWSTVVDAPVSTIKPRGAALAAWGEDRIDRADAYGCSSLPRSEGGPGYDATIIDYNRAGPQETCLTRAEIRTYYREDGPDCGDDWKWKARRAFQDACMGLDGAGTAALWHWLLTMYVGAPEQQSPGGSAEGND